MAGVVNKDDILNRFNEWMNLIGYDEYDMLMVSDIRYFIENLPENKADK